MINYNIECKTKSVEGRSGRVISTSAAREAGYDGSRTFWSVDNTLSDMDMKTWV